MKNDSVLVINVGSSSIKYGLYVNNKSFLRGELQRVVDFSKAARELLATINQIQIRHDLKIKKVAYRVVRGINYKHHALINKSVLNDIGKYIELDPVHAPQTLKVIDFFMKNINAKHIACFDTVFHSTMPEVSKTYAIPIVLSKKHRIKRHGFHGLSHQYMADFAKKYKRVITCQLGNGISISAVKNGKSVDTTMGFTPLEGVMMGTRSGSIDPAIIEYLCKKEHKSVLEITRLLQEESGFKGFTGKTDIRDVIQKSKQGDRNAKLAIDLFCYQIKKQIGAYVAALNGVDAIVLGGGISKNPNIVAEMLSDLDCLGIQLNLSKVKDEEKRPVCISKGKVNVFLVNADEQDIMFEISKKF